jgi:hypothetical protein
MRIHSVTAVSDSVYVYSDGDVDVVEMRTLHVTSLAAPPVTLLNVRLKSD